MGSNADKGTLWCACERKRFPDSEFEQRGFEWVHVVGNSRHWTTGDPLGPEFITLPPASRFERPLREGEATVRADDARPTRGTAEGSGTRPEDDPPTRLDT